MESVGFIALLYIMVALPKELGIEELPWGNWTMAGCFVSVICEGEREREERARAECKH